MYKIVRKCTVLNTIFILKFSKHCICSNNDENYGNVLFDKTTYSVKRWYTHLSQAEIVIITISYQDQMVILIPNTYISLGIFGKHCSWENILWNFEFGLVYKGHTKYWNIIREASVCLVTTELTQRCFELNHIHTYIFFIITCMTTPH